MAHLILLSRLIFSKRNIYLWTLTDGAVKTVRMQMDKIDAMFIGTGDLFAALWLAWSHKHKSDILVSLNFKGFLKFPDILYYIPYS